MIKNFDLGDPNESVSSIYPLDFSLDSKRLFDNENVLIKSCLF